MSSRLLSLWGGLSNVDTGTGWQTLAICPEAPCAVSAAVRHPELLEAVMLEVVADSIPASLDLPEAQGFRVILERRSSGPKGRMLLILERVAGGPFELFTQMVDDVLAVTEAASTEEAAVRAFLARIIAWKRFMNESRPVGLTDEEELGVLGELMVLSRLLDALPPEDAIDSWMGPEDGLQDFRIGQSAIEVKTTLGSQSITHIANLDQLDPSPLESLSLARVKVRLSDQGKTLSEWIDTLAKRCNHAPIFSNKLLAAGYSDLHRTQYNRRFVVDGIHAFSVVEGFPYLCRAMVSPAIREANYLLDLRLAEKFEISMDDAINAATGGGGRGC